MGTPQRRNTVGDVKWREYVTKVIGRDQQNVAAEKAGVDQSAVSRWLRTGQPGRADSVAAFARGYDRPVLEAFVAAGFLTSAEAKQRPPASPDFERLTNDELLELVRARMREVGEIGGDTAPMSEKERAAQLRDQRTVRRQAETRKQAGAKRRAKGAGGVRGADG